MDSARELIARELGLVAPTVSLWYTDAEGDVFEITTSAAMSAAASDCGTRKMVPLPHPQSQSMPIYNASEATIQHAMAHGPSRVLVPIENMRCLCCFWDAYPV